MFNKSNDEKFERLFRKQLNAKAFPSLTPPLQKVIIFELTISPRWIETKIQLNDIEKEWIEQVLKNLGYKLTVAIEKWYRNHIVSRVFANNNEISTIHQYPNRGGWHSNALLWSEKLNTKNDSEETRQGREGSEIDIRLILDRTYDDKDNFGFDYIRLEIWRGGCEQNSNSFFEWHTLNYKDPDCILLTTPLHPKKLYKYYKRRLSDPPRSLGYHYEDNYLTWTVGIDDHWIHDGEVNQIYKDKDKKINSAQVYISRGDRKQHIFLEDEWPFSQVDLEGLEEGKEIYIRPHENGYYLWEPVEPSTIPSLETENFSQEVESEENLEKEINIPEILNKLKNKNSDTKLQALYEVPSITKIDKEVFFAILNLFDDEDPDVKAQSISTLGSFFGFGMIRRYSEHDSKFILWQEDFGKKQFAPKLLKILENENEEKGVRENAVTELDEFIRKSPEIIKVLLKVCKTEKEIMIHYWALCAFGKIDIEDCPKEVLEQVTDQIIQDLRNEAELIRQASISSISRILNSDYDDNLGIRNKVVSIFKDLINNDEPEPNRGKILDILQDIEDGAI